ncbi:MAG: hypothetical protein MMC33_009734 [Icmadophila ericetorum]|nr:hypothetical protein [Icmadophila ericetorum]
MTKSKSKSKSKSKAASTLLANLEKRIPDVPPYLICQTGLDRITLSSSKSSNMPYSIQSITAPLVEFTCGLNSGDNPADGVEVHCTTTSLATGGEDVESDDELPGSADHIAESTCVATDFSNEAPKEMGEWTLAYVSIDVDFVNHKDPSTMAPGWVVKLEGPRPRNEQELDEAVQNAFESVGKHLFTRAVGPLNASQIEGVGIQRAIVPADFIQQVYKRNFRKWKLIVEKREYIAGPKSPGKFTFLSLPAKIRTAIYRYTLVPGNVYIAPFSVIRARSYMPEKYLISDRPENKPGLTLLITCSTIYKESYHYFLSENQFHLICPYLIDNLEPFIGPRTPRLHQQLARIQNLTIYISGMDYAGYKSYMEQLYGLHTEQLMNMIREMEKGSRFREEWTKTLHQIREAKLKMMKNANAFKQIWTEEERKATHDEKIQLCREKLWGPTMTLVRKFMHVKHLTVDVEFAWCPDGCCRLASEAVRIGEQFGRYVNVNEIGIGGTEGNDTGDGSSSGGGGRASSESASNPGKWTSIGPKDSMTDFKKFMPTTIAILGYLNGKEYRAVFAGVAGEQNRRRFGMGGKRCGSRLLDMTGHPSLKQS